MNVNRDVCVNTQNSGQREYQIYSGLQTALQPKSRLSTLIPYLAGRRRKYVRLNSCMGRLTYINLVDSDYKFLKGHFYFLFTDTEP